jgi:hypothetical protein
LPSALIPSAHHEGIEHAALVQPLPDGSATTKASRPQIVLD